jgi:haloalkane dehalogenase
MRILRTPDERFAALPDYPFAPHYTEVDDLRIHHVEEGPAEADPVLMPHGEPTWSFLYRKMIPIVAAAGHRAIAPDLVGFGRSDKPAERADYTYERHVEWMKDWLRALDLRRITLVCQDWGSLIGLRLVAEEPERFARVVVANGYLPTGDGKLPWFFRVWQAFARRSPWFPIGGIVRLGCWTRLPREVVAAYEAPFPSAEFEAGARAFPPMVPTGPTIRRPRRTAARGKPWARGRSRSSPPSATVTRSSAAPTRRCKSASPAPRASRTPPSAAPGTSCRRIGGKSWPGW